MRKVLFLLLFVFFSSIKISAQTWQTLNTSNSLIPTNSAGAPFYIDNNKNKWVNMAVTDLYKFNDTNWTNINQGWQPRAITQDIYNNFYYSEHTYLFYRNGTTWDTLYDGSFSGSLSCYSLAPDNFGNVYALIQLPLYSTPTLFKYNQGNLIGAWLVPTCCFINSFAYHSITVDLQGNPWLILNEKIIKFDGNNFIIYNSTNSNIATDVIFWCINHDNNNNIWIGGFENNGTHGCLQKFDGTNWTYYNTLNSNMTDDKVYDVAIDNMCNVWPLTFTQGLFKFSGNSFTAIPSVFQMLGGISAYVGIDSNKIYSNHSNMPGVAYSVYTDSTISYQSINIDSIVITNNTCSDDSNNIQVFLPSNNSNDILISIDSGRSWQISNMFFNVKNGIKHIYVKRQCQMKTLEIVVQPTQNFVTYTDTVLICQGQTYLNHTITGNYLDTLVNQNGCDTLLYLSLIVSPNNNTTINQSICQGQTYLGYSTQGVHIDTFTNANGCDSIRTINLTVTPTTNSTINQSICQGQSYLSYTTAGTHIDTFQNQYGCDSIRILNLTVNPIIYSTINQTICQPNYYLGYNTSGTFIDTLVSVSGCDSIRTLNLTVNPITYSSISQTICQGQSFLGHSTSGVFNDTLLNAQGCDSVRTLTLTVNPVQQFSINHTICQGQTYLGYSSTGTYIDTFQNQYGCDSIRTLHLTVNPTQAFTINQTICQPNSYLGYSTSGTYIDTFQNQFGCDSIRILNLTANPITYSTINQTICQPNSYLGYNISGIYIDTLVSVNGCDSIRILNLTVNTITYSSVSQTICQGQSFLGHSTTGVFNDTLLNAQGCDSVRTLTLTVNPVQSFTINQTICQPISYLGYNTSGTYIDTFLNQYGCDSIRTLNLIVNPITYSTINQIICEPNTYLGYNTTGTYIDTLTNANGCDSIRTLNLVVHPITSSTIIDTICQGQNTFGYTISGTHIDTLTNSNGCDSIRTLQLFVHPKTFSTLSQQICDGSNYLGYTTQGQYIDTLINANGCDSIRTLNLIVHPTYFIDTSINLCNGDSLFCGGNWQSTAGIYWDSLSSNFGCDSVVKTTLSFTQKLNPIIQGNKEFCIGDSIFLLVNNNFKHYLWNTGDTTSWFYITQGGQYSVIVNNEGLCFGYDTVDVVVNSLPNVRIDFTQKDMCKFDTITLNATGANTYTWSSPFASRIIGNSNPLIFSIEASPVNVIVKGTDENNCINYDSITLHYINCCGTMFIPNAFSPNGDGHNDYFKPIYKPTFTQTKFEDYEIRIVNRFGQVVFQTNDMQNTWDGTFLNKPCELGTYYYLIKTKCFESKNNEIIKGDINLLR